jgi:Na+-transporting NADH:ubiquinone oxidoreductase subunit A
MFGKARDAGLLVRFPSPPEHVADARVEITDEAGLTGPNGQDLRIGWFAEEGTSVAQGAPIATLRDDKDFALVAPMPAKVARVRMQPGKRLTEIVLFADASAGRHRHSTSTATRREEDALRRLLMTAGMWPLFRRRPFGRIPERGERPAAIFVMAIDTRPLSVDPAAALTGKEEAFGRGLDALAVLTDGPIFVCQPAGPALFEDGAGQGRVECIVAGRRHPQGMPGYWIHSRFPAGLDAPVWDCHAEDVAAIGELLADGFVPETRLVRIAGDGLKRERLVRTQPGADLRDLTQSGVLPGTHRLISGSPLDGVEARWLGARDRQVTVRRHKPPEPERHWFADALMRRALPKPMIPTAALSQAFGASLPSAAFVRALTAGDSEMAVNLGLLSLLEEDLALADFVLSDAGGLLRMLRGMLGQLELELGK